MAEQKIQGKEDGGRWENEADKVTASKMKPVYESAEFTVPGAPYVDYDVKLGFPGPTGHALFQQFARAHTIIIRTDTDMSIKLNSNTAHSISLLAAEGVLTLDIVEMSDIFITAPTGATIKIILV